MGNVRTTTPIGMNDGMLTNEMHFFDSLDQQSLHPVSLPHLAPPVQAAPVSTTNSPLFTCFSSQPQSKSPSPSSSSSSNKRKASSDQDPEEQAAIKRQRNTMAARKYRQKRLDRIAELEKALEEMTADRDGLRLDLARKEAQVDALKEMLKK